MKTGTYTLDVPLRKAWNITRFKRAPRAITIIRNTVVKHMKVAADEEVYISQEVNEAIWSRGIENPPRKIKLSVTRHEGGDFPVEVELYKE